MSSKSEDVVKNSLDTSDEREVTFKESAASDKFAQPKELSYMKIQHKNLNL